jgi:phage gp29-like protein
MTIVDVNGNPLSIKQVLEYPQTDSPRVANIANEMATHPSQRLTPRRLQGIFQDAENGNLIAQSDLFADMEERDSQIFADMQKRKLVLTTLKREVQPLANATPAEVADAAYLNEVIQSLDGWEDLILDMADGIGKGFSNQEIRWGISGREYYPYGFDWRPQSWFTIAKEDQNKLLLRTDNSTGEPLRPFGWISHKPKSRSGYVARAGLMRTLAWPYIYRNFGGQGLAEMLEIYGLPIRIGKYPAGSGKTERSELMKAVTTIGRSAGGIMPDTMKMEIVAAASGSSEPFLALAEWAEKSISKTVLGGTLTSQADGKTSTNALGLIHNEVRLDLMDADARQCGTTIRSDLLYPLLVLNRNPHADPRRTPKLVFPELEEIRKRAEQPGPAAARYEINFNRPPQDNSTALVSLARAMLRQNSNEPASETGIEDAISALMASSEPGREAAAMLAPALEAIANTLTPEQMLGALSETFPKMDVRPLAGNLGDYMAIARYIGMYAAQQEQE